MSDRNLAISVSLSAVNKLSNPVNAAKQSTAGLASQIKATQDTLRQLQGQSKTFERLATAVKKDTAAYEKAKSSVKALREQYPPLNQQTDEQKRKLANARLERSRFSRALDKEKQKLKSVSEALKQQGISTKHTDDVTAQVIQRTEHYNRQLSEQKRRLNAVTHAQNQYAKAKEVRNKLAQGGAMALAGGASVEYGVARFLKPGFEFDEAMSQVQARTGLAKDSAQFKALREQAKAIGGADVYNAKDAAAGQKFLAMAGFTPEAIQAALPAVLKMGLAGDMQLADVADKGSDILAKFGLDAGQMEHLADVLSVSTNRGKTSMSELSEAMAKAAPTANQLGMNITSLSTMLTVLSQNGLRGGGAGTMLSGSLMKLVTPVKKGKGAIEALGVSVKDSQGRLRDMGSILLDVGKSLRGFDQVSQTKILKDLFGAENAPAMKALIDAVTQGRFNELQSELNGAAGAAEKLAKVKADNLPTDILLLSSAWEALRVEVAETTTEALRPVIQTFTRIVEKVTQWVKMHPQLTKVIVLGTMAVAGFVAILGALALAASAVIVPMATLRLGLFLLMGGRGLGGLIPKLGFFSQGLKGLLPSVGRLGFSVRGWVPIFSRATGAVGRLTRGIGALVRSRLGQLLGVAGKIGRGLMTAFTRPTAVISGLRSAVSRLAVGGFGTLLNIGRAVMMAIGSGLSFLLSPIGLLVAAIVAAGVLIYKYWEPIKAFFSGFWDGFTEALAPLGETFHGVFSTFSPIIDGISDAVGKVWQWFKDLLEPVQLSSEEFEQCTSAGKRFGEVVGEAITLLLIPIKKVMEGIGWILEKLGLIPELTDEAAKIAAIAPSEQNGLDALKPNKGEGSKKIVATGDGANKPNNDNTKPPPAPMIPSPRQTEYGHKIYDSGQTGKGRGSSQGRETLPTNNTDRDKLGEIVFKNHPDVMKLRGMYQEPLIAQKPPVSLGERFKGMLENVVSVLPSSVAHPVPVIPPRPVDAPHQNDYVHFELNFHGVDVNNEKKLAEVVKREINKLLQQRDSRRRSRLSDKD